MKTRKMFKLILMATTALAVSLTAAACTRFVNDQNKQPAEQIDEIGWQVFSEPALNGEVDQELKWTQYSDERFTFDYPENWLVKVETNRIELKNTAKEIVTGGAAPEDYYLEGTTNVNTEKYATDYYLLTVQVYDGFANWDQFFSENYAGVVMSYQPYQLPTRPDLKNVVPTKVSGVLYGDQRFFASDGQSILDVSLTHKGWDGKQAQKVLNTFLKNFSF